MSATVLATGVTHGTSGHFDFHFNAIRTNEEVDCMACVAASVGDQWSEPARVFNPCGEIALEASGNSEGLDEPDFLVGPDQE